MGITAEWDNEEKTIIRHIYVGEITWDEFETVAHRHTTIMLDSVEHIVDIIADVEKVIPPKGILAHFREIASSAPFTHPNAGLVVMVRAGSFVMTTINLFCKVYNQLGEKLVTVPTLEEAYAIIAEHRQHRTS